MLFIGLILKNTADAVAIFAKCLEYLIVPRDALMGYYWTYSVALIVVDLLVVPPVYYIIKRYFTYEIRETISKRWRYIWAVPFFFYLSGLYVFSVPSVESDLELACMPMNSVFLLCSISCQYTIYISLATLVKSLQRQAQLQEENHAIQLQAIQYDYIQNQISEDRRLRHDLRHHFTVINSLVEGQEYERLGKYLSEYITPALWQSQVHYCPNAILNIMASYYANKCYSNSIACYIRLNVPEQLPLSDTEITVLFGNLLENAFNACMEIPEGQSRSLALRGELINDSLLFTLENSYLKEGTKLKKGEKACPHKGMGIGISSCQNIVNAHNGSMEIEMSEIYVVKLFFEFMR